MRSRGYGMGTGRRAVAAVLVAVLVLAGVGMAPVSVRAAVATYYVGNGGDTSGGNCTTMGNTTCTLHDAVAASNANDPGTGQNTITFASSVTVVTLTTADASDSTSGLALTKNVAITGPMGGTLVVQRSGGAGAFRIFYVGIDVTATLSNLTIRSGTTVSGSSGGGILNGGTVTLTNSTVSGNTASSGSGSGGGIYNFGTATLTNSTVSGNTASSGGLGGGGIYNNGTVTLTNSTVSGNTATGSGGSGGGIRNFGGTVTLTNVTVSGNTASIGGGIRNNSILNATNSIVAGNTGDDLSGSINGTNTSNLTSGTPLLAPLGSYGGPTQTRPPLPGSPAINAGNAAACAASPVSNLDQRGVSRTAFGTCDIGAVESRGFVVGAGSGGGQSAAANTPFGLPLAVLVFSGYSEPTDGGTITFTAPASGAGIALTPVVATIIGNVATTNVAANTTVGSYSVTATAAGGSGPLSFALTNTPGNATVIALSGVSAVVSSGSPFAFAGRITDSFGNTVTTYTGTLSFTSSDGTATLPTAYPFTAADMGQHTFTATLNSVGSGRTITLAGTGGLTAITPQIEVRQPAPRITGFTPNRGVAGSTAAVTITGTGFQAGATVKFGTVSATVPNVTATSITVTAPAIMTAGTYTITVTNPDTQTAMAGPFAYYPASGVPAAPGMRAVPGGPGSGGMAPAPAPAPREPAGGSGGNGPSGVPAPGGEVTPAATPLPAPARR